MDGRDGVDGVDGVVGPQGLQGIQGQSGNQGAPGLDGDSDGFEQAVYLIPNGPAKPEGSIITLTGISGNQGTVDISGLECGGTLAVSAPAGDWRIEGFTSTPLKPDGFWFCLSTPNTAGVVGTLLEESAAAANADKIRNAGALNGNATGLQAIIFKTPSTAAGSPRWRVISGAVARLVGSDGVNPDNVIDLGNGGSSDISISSANNITIQSALGSTNFVDVNTGDFTVDASDLVRLDGAAIQLNGGANGVLVANSNGANQGRIKIVEGATPLTNSAGQGQLWVESTAPCRLVYRHDENVDLPLNSHVVARLTATSTITAATATDIISYTRPANSDRVGTTYRIKAICQHTKTAVTTTSPTFTLAVGGTLFTAILITQPTAAAATFTFNVEAVLTIRSLGAAGAATWAAAITVNGNSQFAVTSPNGAAATGNTTLTTTASQTVALRGQVATVVAGNNIITEVATIERLD
jgi:hypothetical protein